MNSPIKWVGGKRKEIKHFEKYLPEDYKIYVEPFVGGGALFWHLQPDKSIINDINEHLINFYKILKGEYEKLNKGLQKYENSKEYYSYIVNKLNSNSFVDNIEKAQIFYYLNKTSFSGKWRVNSKGEFNSGYGYYKKDNYKSVDNQCIELLKNTEILNCDYKILMERFKYDDNAFIFLDPPYLDCDTFYTDNQSFENIYDYISEYIKECKCKIMLVVKENEYISNLFSTNVIHKYDVNYRHTSTSKIIHKHLVITNYKIN